MTADQATAAPSSHEAGGPGPDRSLPLLVAAGILVVAVVAAVLLFGVQRPPPLPSLADDPSPAPDVAVAWSTWQNGTCVHVGEPHGETRELWCADTGADLLGWTEEGHLLVTDWSEERERSLFIDPSSGEVIRTEPARYGGDPEREWEEGFEPSWSREQVVRDHRSDGDLVVEEPEGTEVWRVASPESYLLRTSSLSPDGRWLAAVDTADRLLLISTDGGAPVRVWATGVDTGTEPMWAHD